ncbi:hypothetical protein [Limimaricola litoreus]|uniref:Uncharacterized protein n=1 Tax=Limimaricola litoreus TaxID=2955316 RepID=A0A9X2JQ36_9RHOB|nr:hypothetical protein [Limimaricola litoreus]MCP1168900.1 hypothetical protein [Limimaricola litoreus]
MIDVLEIEIGMRSSVWEFARETAEMWLSDEMMAITEEQVLVVATPAHLEDEAMCERIISLIANTPGLADRVADTVASHGADPRRSSLSLTIRRDDAAPTGLGNPWRGAERMRALLGGSDSEIYV